MDDSFHQKGFRTHVSHGSQEPATLAAVTGRQSMEGPAPGGAKQLPSASDCSRAERANHGSFGGKPLWPHRYLSTGHRLGQTGHTGCILTRGVELGGSTGHQLCPEQKMNSSFLFTHGFHLDPLPAWSQYIFFLLNA